MLAGAAAGLSLYVYDKQPELDGSSCSLCFRVRFRVLSLMSARLLHSCDDRSARDRR